MLNEAQVQDKNVQEEEENTRGRAAMNIYRLMDDTVLDAALLDLERVVTQPGFRAAPASTQAFYWRQLDAVRNEIERRRTL